MQERREPMAGVMSLSRRAEKGPSARAGELALEGHPRERRWETEDTCTEAVKGVRAWGPGLVLFQLILFSQI